MNKSLIALALASAFAVPSFAQTSSSDATGAPPAALAEPAGPHTFTGNMTIASSYRFRGIDQTFNKPALQGGVDYSHESGIYVGNWNSNVNSGAGFPEGNLEMDFYGGWKKAFGDFGLDVGGLYYYYPGSTATPLSNSNSKNLSATSSGTVNNGELYIAGSWKFITLKYNYAVTDYFSLPDSKGTSYLDL
ncbi:MAG: TorF family putative porin, partial [Azonexus sp.]